MDATEEPISDLTAWAVPLLETLYDKLPSMLVAAAIILLGWLAARLARSGARRLADRLNRFLERTFRRGSLATVRVPGSALAVIGEILFWLVLLFALAVAARVAGIKLFTAWLDDVVTHFPHLVLGTLIIVLGWVIAARLGSRDERAESLSRRLGQIMILLIATVIGLEQIGISMMLPVVLLGIASGALCLAFSIAFGLGARQFVSASIAGRVLSRQLQPGMHVQLGQFEGEVIDVTGTHLLLDSESGHVLAPLSDALDVAIIISRSDSEESAGNEQ